MTSIEAMRGLLHDFKDKLTEVQNQIEPLLKQVEDNELRSSFVPFEDTRNKFGLICNFVKNGLAIPQESRLN